MSASCALGEHCGTQREGAHLVEGALVPVLLQELLLALGLVVAQFVGVLEVFFEALLLGQRAAALDFEALLLLAQFLLLVALYACELAQAPRLEFGLGLEPVGVVHVGHELFRFLCECGKVRSGEVNGDGAYFRPVRALCCRQPSRMTASCAPRPRARVYELLLRRTLTLRRVVLRYRGRV